MSTYEEAGVNIELGDAASRTAYAHAKSTFAERQGMIGEPVAEDEGFAGLLNFGDFYLTQCCDTVGTKIDLAERLNDFSGLGNDLLAMVADDAVCLGAEVVSITNTFETHKVEHEKIDAMMKSLAKICKKQKVVIAGGEIAEVGDKVNGTSWGADAVGIVERKKLIDAKNVKVGDVIISLREHGFRCNGLSLVRKILKDNFSYESTDWKKFAKSALEPSIVYHDAILALHGRYKESAKVEIHAIAHITGGGIAGNFRRVLKKNGFGARLDEIYHPSGIVDKFQELGLVADAEAYKTWNMGNGMMIVLQPDQANKALSILKVNGIEAKVAGTVTKNPTIFVRNFGRGGGSRFLEYN